MPPPVPPVDQKTLAKLLDDTKLGSFSLPITSLQYTDIGRPLHLEGVAAIRVSIKDKGWLGSKMTACVLGSMPVGGLTAENAADQQYKLINGNHRLAALLELLAEKRVGNPSCDATVIEIDVHQPLGVDQERLVASSLNAATELVVKTTLSDRVVWYKAWHDDEQAKQGKKTTLSPNAVASRLQRTSTQMGLISASLPTIKSFMKVVQAIKPRGLAALHDVTHLPGRPDGHIDCKEGKLKFSRVTLKSLLREQFADLSDTEQEAYVYRLASGAFLGVMTEANFKTLDDMAKDVARMVESTETHLGPVSGWTDAFKWVVAKARNYELSSKFVTHFNNRDAVAEAYQRALPVGMAADATYTAWIKSQPWPPLLTAIKGTDMQGVLDTYTGVKQEKKEEAEASQGRFKTKLAEMQKEATAAAAAAEAAKAAKALVASTAEAAKAAKTAEEEASKTAAETTAKAAAPSPAATPSPPAASEASTTPDPGATLAEAGPMIALPEPKPAEVVAGAAIAGSKRKAEQQDAAKELTKRARPLMTKLVNIDIFAPGLDAETDIQHPAKTPFMLAFVNIAANGSVLTADDGAVLKRALTFLTNNLNDRGTIVMAMPDFDFPRTKLKGWFQEAGLTLEESPVLSLYLHGKSGRLAEKNLFVYPTQGSVVLLAHKGPEFICNGGGPRSRGGGESSSQSARASRGEGPRTPELDRIGAVVMHSHPPAGTYLPEETAELLIKRFSDVGDPVLLSAGHRDTSLARTALRKGRTLVVLEPDLTKIDDTAKKLDVLTLSAAREGMWARMLSGPVVTVGPNKLPVLVPESNVPISTALALQREEENKAEEPPREVANNDASMHGLEIKTSNIHGQGLFATRNLSSGSFVAVPLVGTFVVHDSFEESVDAGKKEGLPRFLVSDNMALFLSEGEVARPNAGLYLVPHNTSPLFYMNSSCDDPDTENFQFSSVLKPRDFKNTEDKRGFLSKPQNSVVFNVACNVKKDTELLAFYGGV